MPAAPGLRRRRSPGTRSWARAPRSCRRRRGHDVAPVFCVALRDFAAAAAFAAQAFGPRAAVVPGVYGVMMLIAGAALAAAERRGLSVRPRRARRRAG